MSYKHRGSETAVSNGRISNVFKAYRFYRDPALRKPNRAENFDEERFRLRLASYLKSLEVALHAFEQ